MNWLPTRFFSKQPPKAVAAFSPPTTPQLEAALLDAISQILAATFSFATPVVPTTGTSGARGLTWHRFNPIHLVLFGAAI